MKKYLIVLAAIVATLAVPFLLRPSSQRFSGPIEGSLTIISPHVESIRSEFTRGFQEHMRNKYRKNVEIQWITPGGTSEIDKYLDTEYRAAFENFWPKARSEPWQNKFHQAVSSSKLPNNADADLKQARELFLNSNLGIKIDLFFGGGTHDFERQKEKGYLVATDPDGKYGPAAIKKVHPDWFTDAVIPQSFGGQNFYDPQFCWIGNCLSSFGIIYNKDVLERLGIYTPPTSWEDLTHPNYADNIALADPGKSGSVTKAFEMIIQQQIQSSLARAAKLRSNPTTSPSDYISEADAIGLGWVDGLKLIQKIGANARYFTDSAPRPPLDVARGEAAAGMCIDFYGRTFVEKHQKPDGTCRVAYFTPPGGSAISADPIAMFRGSPSPELATQFMEFVLSIEGQRLWGCRTGTPGGPTGVALRRLPIRKDFYLPKELKNASDPDEMPYEKNTFVYNANYTAPTYNSLRVIIRAMCMDSDQELHTAWKSLSDNGFPPIATRNFADMSFVTYDKVTKHIAVVLNGENKVIQARLARDLTSNFRNQYIGAAEMALRKE